MYQVVVSLLNAFVLICLARAVLSWFPGRSGAVGAARGVVHAITDPVVLPVRQAMVRVGIGGGPFDFSLLVVILGVNFVAMPLAAALLR